GVTFFCISDTLVPTTYLVDTTLSNSSDSDQTVQAVRLPFKFSFLLLSNEYFHVGQHDLLLLKNQASSMITGI
ncbi:hypothetical protein, partial [Escherichia coli]|uniref:hypothetical protein n=1 Tax=Escherichia coli TaxID=562 RepID=UPI001BB098D4